MKKKNIELDFPIKSRSLTVEEEKAISEFIQADKAKHYPQTTDSAADNSISGIALGSTPEDLKNRKKFITDFYAKWIIVNPTKQIYNKSLKNFIEVRFLSMQETASKAAIRYKSTLAVTYLTEILENAIITGEPQEPKKDNVKQKRFSKIYIMEHEKADFGKIKLTVGELRGSGQKLQYCITAIENDY